MKKLNLIISSKIGNTCLVENFLETLIQEFRLEKELCGRVILATIEATNNACLWGVGNDDKKKVTINACIKNSELFISVEDQGEGFDYTKIPDPTTPENIMKKTGRGLYLMKALCDNLKFQKKGSKVILKFSLNSES
ncbi:ATP-binding protein [Culturomica massiliensis]|jgi:serine/threonine-protein kinase RsbW|uniref:ATP-binding protein n=1 Tax=Culturomica massiliensis TaxID=1841857 RepID=UPI000E55ABF6|nr:MULTISPECIES: ATP-binding protein [Odoribacteraceae]RHV86818.1 ATP-binding protein [Odoribacter sp. OF09-27XD]